MHSFPQQQQEKQHKHEELQSLNIERKVDAQPSYNVSNDAIDTKANNKTLNSTLLSVNATSEFEKPVLKHIDRNVQSNETTINATQNRTVEKEAATTTTTTNAAATSVTNEIAIDDVSDEEANMSWLPIGWIPNLHPSNAIVITDTNPLRIWAIGSINKFPAFFERFVQRIQSYYSIYKYHDLSRPGSLAVINPQYPLHSADEETTDDAFFTETNTVTTNEIEIETTTEPLTYGTDDETKTEINNEVELETETETANETELCPLDESEELAKNN